MQKESKIFAYLNLGGKGYTWIAGGSYQRDEHIDSMLRIMAGEAQARARQHAKTDPLVEKVILDSAGQMIQVFAFDDVLGADEADRSGLTYLVVYAIRLAAVGVFADPEIRRDIALMLGREYMRKIISANGDHTSEPVRTFSRLESLLAEMNNALDAVWSSNEKSALYFIAYEQGKALTKGLESIRRITYLFVGILVFLMINLGAIVVSALALTGKLKLFVS